MNERIDHTNHEAWLLDRLEGNLTPDQERQLDAFLVLHPELAPEVDELPTLPSPVGTLSAADKEALKRTLPPTGLPGEAPLDDLLIAQLEGDLTPAQADALHAYLAAHPEHACAERLYALTKLVPAALACAQKRELQRTLPPQGPVTRFTLDDFLVARLEGDLTAAQDAALTAYLAVHPEAVRAWATMQRARVEAAPMVFAHKAGLKKKEGRVIALHAGARSWVVRLAAAASVAVLLGIGLWLLKGKNTGDAEFADTEEPAVNKQQPSTSNDERAVQERNDHATDDHALAANERSDTATQNGTTDRASENVADARDGRTPRDAQRATPRLEDRESVLPLAQQRPTEVQAPQPQVVPQNVPVPEVPVVEESLAAVAPAPAAPTSVSLGGLVASAFRDRVLEQPVADTRPLDGNDAVAAVDKGLKAVAGDHAGLRVQRTGGRLRGFDLRLGRNLAIASNQ